jgi:CRP/FNR family transcriptional regulator, cyclic AMP receptor protein
MPSIGKLGAFRFCKNDAGRTTAIDDEEGIRLLSSCGWLSGAPADFRQALLARCRWHNLQAGETIQAGGEEAGELIGLAQGVIEMRTILGRADTPIMHIAHPVFWIGFGPIIFGQPRRVAASAKTRVKLARITHSAARSILAERPEWWLYFNQHALIYGDIVVNIAADLLIRDSERRCAATLLRMSGRRFPGPEGSKPVSIPLRQDELAGAANLSRNSVGILLKRLEARGLIETTYGAIKVLAPAALRAFIEQE